MGDGDGIDVGSAVGEGGGAVGVAGAAVSVGGGAVAGRTVGGVVSSAEGDADSIGRDALSEGAIVGDPPGFCVGLIVGFSVGEGVGFSVGCGVGAGV